MNKKLRITWIIPNVFCYLMLFSFSGFIIWNAEELQDMNQLGIWVFVMIALLLVSIFGTYRIWSWIKEGKM